MSKWIKRMCTSVLVLAVMVSISGSACASLLIYEGFNGYTSGALTGQAVNGNTIGLTGTYVEAVYSGITATTSGLTFGSGATTYAVSGGSIVNPTTNYAAVGIGLNTGTISGTLYGSYLFQLGTAYGPSGGTRIETRFSTVSNSATTQAYLDSAVLNNGGKMSLKYDASSTAVTSADITATLNGGVTYMAISKWTGVSTGSGTGALWILTSAQYDASGGILTESYLNSNALLSMTASGSGSSVLNNSDFMQFLIGGNADNRALDEIKYGTTLLDVTAVPEPSSMAMLLGAGAFLFVSVCRRRLNSREWAGASR